MAHRHQTLIDPKKEGSVDTHQRLNGLTGGADGQLYFTENRSIRRVTMQGHRCRV